MTRCATIFAAGDIINVRNETGLLCSPELTEIISSADYSVCNFEAPVSGFGSPQPKNGPHRDQRPETLHGLRQQGFDLILLSNNHIMDFGADGLEATIRHAKEAGLDYLGAGLNQAEAYKPLIKEINGLKVGIINACEAQFGVLDYFSSPQEAGYAWINHRQIDIHIIALRKQCDFVIVFAHAGLEGYPIPQKEWRERYKHFCELGADAVIGSHPHVAQGFERVGKSIIFYSLGDFYFDSLKSPHRRDFSYAINLKLCPGIAVEFEPVFVSKEDTAVRVAPADVRIDLRAVSDLLSKGYDQELSRISEDIYRMVRGKIKYCMNRFPMDRGLKGWAKRIPLLAQGRLTNPDKTTLELHMFRNESYYFAVKHALSARMNHKKPIVKVSSPTV